MNSTERVSVTLSLTSGRDLRLHVKPSEFKFLDDWYRSGKSPRLSFQATTWASGSPVVVTLSHEAVEAMLVDVPA